MAAGIEQQKEFYSNASLIDAHSVKRFGKTLVIAPHQDDESIGCGGTIALLRESGVEVHILFVSDGSMSHPNSKKYDARMLSELRKTEAINAANILGVTDDKLHFMHLKDSKVPTPDDNGFAYAVLLLKDYLEKIRPETVLVTWRRDPHKDHRASWQLVNTSIILLNYSPEVLEYPIWLWELGTHESVPVKQEVDYFKVDISHVLNQKQQAIAAHRSQVTRMIDDDEKGFYFSPELLAYFTTGEEILFRSNPLFA